MNTQRWSLLPHLIQQVRVVPLGEVSCISWHEKGPWSNRSREPPTYSVQAIDAQTSLPDAKLALINLFKPAGGLIPEEVQDAVRIIAQRFSIPGAAVTAYDPDADPEKKGLRAGLALITLLGEIGANQLKVS